MQLAMIGLGRMGGNMARRLAQDGHELIVYDQSAEAVKALAGKGVTAAKSIADVAKHLAPRCRVVGVEPAAGNDVTLSFKSKKIIRIEVPETIADGARTQAPGDVTFPLILRNVDDMLTVTDDELLRAMFYLWERLKTIVEPTGALGACALFEKKVSASGQRVGVLLSGGNVDLRWAATAWRARP